MSARDEQMFGLPFGELCRLIADTPADDPPGAIAAAAAALAIAAGLAEKCVVERSRAALAQIATRALDLAVRDADAYRAWRDGDEQSPAICAYPDVLAALADDLVGSIDQLPPHPLTGDTDLRAARALARGVAEMARAVTAGNRAHLSRSNG